jgi:VWFA-related protein
MKPAVLLWSCLALMGAERPALRRVDISARDKAGRPVRDLRASDIELRDGGLKQPLVFFRHWTGEAAPHVVTVVLDLMEWWPRADAANAWDETVAALRRFEATEDVYFYVLIPPAGALVPVRPLPESEAEAAAPDHRWVDRVAPQVTALRDTLRPPLAWDKQGGFDSPLEASYMAADTVAAKMELLAGRKALVWIGEERLMPRARDWPDRHSPSAVRMIAKVRRLEGRMNRGDIAMFSVRPAIPVPVGDVGLAMLGVSRPQLPRLAHVTGGRDGAMGDIARAIGEAVAETSEGYRAFYQPPPRKPLEEYREVQTRTKRRDTRLLAQAGYDFDPDDEAAEVRQRLLMDRAVKALRDSIDIPVRVQEGRLIVDANALLLRQDRGQFVGALLVQFVSYGAAESRKEITADPVRVDLNFSREDLDRVLRDGLALPLRVALDPAARRLRAIVCDLGSETAGSATIDIPRRPE